MTQPQRGDRKTLTRTACSTKLALPRSLQSFASHADCLILAAVTTAPLDSNTASSSE